MSDAAVATPAAPAKSAKRKSGASKVKKASSHPKYSNMIKDALAALKERGGSSRQAILKYIVKHYSVGHDERVINAHLKLALRAGVKNGSLKQSKGTGASGSFRIGVEKETKPKKPKAARAKKPKAKKPKAAGAKKAKKPKKAGETKAKKPKTKKPKVAKKPKAAKPKAAKTAKPKKPKVAKAKKVGKK